MMKRVIENSQKQTKPTLTDINKLMELCYLTFDNRVYILENLGPIV